MFTATLALVLVGGLSPGVNVALPNLHTDYALARTAATDGNKPIAVIIGRGDMIGRMLVDGTISADAAKLLRENYVYLYVDSQGASGTDLASRFALTEGLVISSPGGGVQAYRHAGLIGGAELTRQLTQYAAAGQPTVTVLAGAQPTVVGSVPYGTSGVIIPASGQIGAPQYTIPGGGYVYPGFGSPGFSPYCAPGRH